jgi:sodium-dependent dicarboxylate transporter 2/3/5
MRRRIGFAAGLIIFVAVLLLPPPDSFLGVAREVIAKEQAAVAPHELAASMRGVLALMSLMVVWWFTEAVPMAATALLPAALLPVLGLFGLQRGARMDFTLATVSASYASPVIFLFLGGFLLAAAMQKWHLDRRLTLWLLSRGRIAEGPRTVLLGVMAVTAFLSMWISNTATAAMMLPLGTGILASFGCRPGQSHFGTAMMLGIAWSASIGGMGTLIGTPPNGIAAGIINAAARAGGRIRPIGFLDWMSFGVPYVLLLLPLAWAILVRLYPPEEVRSAGARERLRSELSAMGPLSGPEKRTIGVFLLAAALWLSTPFRENILPPAAARALASLDEYWIGIFAGVLLFLVPVSFREGRFLLEWSDAKSLEWGVLILFGGGIALSEAMFKSGLAVWVASSFVSLFGSPSMPLMVFVIVALNGLLTEITSNTAVTTMMVPVVISVAERVGLDPVALAIAAALAASLAFILPVATPPNALVYATGYVRLPQMVRAGIVVEVVGWFLTTAVLIGIAGWLLGIVRV